jgi:hypothetical protein
LTERKTEALVNLVRERVRHEDRSMATAISFEDGEIIAALQNAVDKISESVPYLNAITFRRALPVTANYIVAAEDVGAFTGGETCTIAHQPDTPRNLTILYTEAAGVITALVVTVVGTDADDDVLTEVFTFVDSLDITGESLFKTVTSVTVTTITGNGVGDTLDVGIGSSVMSSREVDLTALPVMGVLTDMFSEPHKLNRVYQIEYPIGNTTPTTYGVTMLTDTIMRMPVGVTHDANVRLFYGRKHILTAETTTLPPNLENVAVDGACHFLLLSLGGEMDNAVPLGANAANNLKSTCMFYLDKFEKGMKQATSMKIVRPFGGV